MICDTYCTHGGECSLEAGHDGLHDASGYCQWADEDSVDKAEADARFIKTGGTLAEIIIEVEDTIRDRLQ